MNYVGLFGGLSSRRAGLCPFDFGCNRHIVYCAAVYSRRRHKGYGDAPNVPEYQKETYLYMVQRYAKDTGEEIGAVSYQVLLCDDNGMFWGLKSDSLVDYKVIAWKEITGRNYEEVALAYQRQGTVK